MALSWFIRKIATKRINARRGDIRLPDVTKLIQEHKRLVGITQQKDDICLEQETVRDGLDMEKKS